MLSVREVIEIDKAGMHNLSTQSSTKIYSNIVFDKQYLQ